MIVDGTVEMVVTLHVCSLKTDAVYKNEYGEIKISDPDSFFLDWVNDWENGMGELLGCHEENTDLEEIEDDWEEDDEDDWEEDEEYDD